MKYTDTHIHTNIRPCKHIDAHISLLSQILQLIPQQACFFHIDFYMQFFMADGFDS